MICVLKRSTFMRVTNMQSKMCYFHTIDLLIYGWQMEHGYRSRKKNNIPDTFLAFCDNLAICKLVILLFMYDTHSWISVVSVKHKSHHTINLSLFLTNTQADIHIFICSYKYLKTIVQKQENKNKEKIIQKNTF